MELEGLSREEAEALRRALEAEASNPPDPHRGRARVEARDGVLRVEIEARDLSAARTLVNAYLGLAAATLEAVRAAGAAGHGSASATRGGE